ncbi:50S ribosomal protein L3 [Mesomycoplasma neurolyticum]|uniref:Large ribosomal subunit protein uL3 n=1 Tax=Mesomycoplasma neurolyticum TaxID=2120 RepID=A0A449A663_9BACT|nr:50S ribosomal protein L3 [Mesomycoplasma neurolyticum]VEU59726.1 50S ribosomal protein L3 [Mesomycoplasma neurolyticum]
MKGILGKKIGMTQVYSVSGQLLPVTVIEVKPNVVVQLFTKEKDGYIATQLGLEDKKKSRINKPSEGHFKKANTTPKRFVKEIRGMEGHQLGELLNASIFNVGDLVDITGTSKGKGFAGAIKRHNQTIGPKSHGGGGGSQPIRQTGSIGDISGNKVVKGMTMPGQMGNVKRTMQNLEIIDIDVKNNYILVKGSVPGANKSFLVIKSAVKKLPAKSPVELINKTNETKGENI